MIPIPPVFKIAESLLPARAGMIPLALGVVDGHGTAPRTRGDDPFFVGLWNGIVSCSPHARG